MPFHQALPANIEAVVSIAIKVVCTAISLQANPVRQFGLLDSVCALLLQALQSVGVAIANANRLRLSNDSTNPHKNFYRQIA